MASIHPEHRHPLGQFLSLRLLRLRSRRGLLDPGRILLRHLVHLADGLADLLDAVPSKIGRVGNPDYPNGRHRGCDPCLDFLGRGRRALRQAADFGGYHRETALLFAGPANGSQQHGLPGMQ